MVYPVPDHKSRTEGLSRLKIDKKEGEPRPHIQLERSKVYVIRFRSEALSWRRHLTNKFTNIGEQSQKLH